jgi:hypothetical protein
MSGEANFSRLIKSMKPVLNDGEFVFCSFSDLTGVDLSDAICIFKEQEGTSVILPKRIADERQFRYSFIASWITLMVHSSLEAVGLTAAASKALAAENISCNVVAGFYHDHIFVASKDAERAMRTLGEIGSRDARQAAV